MLQLLLSKLRNRTSNDAAEKTQRRHPRRKADHCIIVIGNQAFPVENWSACGVLFGADDRMFSLGAPVDFTLKFKLRNSILEVAHRGYIVRKGALKIALEFEPLTKTIRRYFQQVIDDHAAREFANSQTP